MEPSLPALIAEAESGNVSAADALFSALYVELHSLARRELARQGLPISLGATTLLHQAYIEMASKDEALFLQRAAFMGYAARVMRGLIIDYARRNSAQKRGGLFQITTFVEEECQAVDDRQLSKISDALDELAKAEPALAQIVDLKFFCGFSFAEIAAMQNLSERTLQRHWEKARIYLHHTLQGDCEV